MEEPTEELPSPEASAVRSPASRARPDTSWAAFAGVVLIVLGLGMWALSRFTVGDERHSFAAGATPPTSFQLQSGHSYSLGIHGGARTARSRGVDLSTLSCSIAPAGDTPQQLGVAPDANDTKAENEIARFQSPLGGRVRISCLGLPAVFVDNADDAGTDWSGTLLLLASGSLALGLPLLLSAAGRPRARRGRPRADARLRRDADDDASV